MLYVNAVYYNTTNTNVPQRAAQPGIAADRFAHEIVGFLTVVLDALAAAELQRWAAQPVKLHVFSTQLT